VLKTARLQGKEPVPRRQLRKLKKRKKGRRKEKKKKFNLTRHTY
jgi:hypothetical protein